jgi:hypothetical protein
MRQPKSREQAINRPDIESDKKIVISDVYFPGDSEGNRSAQIEAMIKGLNEDIDKTIFVSYTDKLKNQLIEYQELLKSKIDWVTPLGILITIIAALVVADFKDTLGIKADIWNAVFILSLFISFVWLIVSIYRSYKASKNSNIDKLVEKIRNRK